MKKILTLCMVCGDGQILLGMKKRGFGAGHWNGFGGKVEEGETIEEAALREVKEEVSIEPLALEKVGILDFSFESESKELEVHIFKVTDFVGEPTESEEMSPRWFGESEIPFSNMWSDDEFWFPYLLSGKTFRGKFLFDRPSDTDYTAKIVEQELYEVGSL